jgi:hypothetical protein
MSNKPSTVAFDSAGELARLAFSFDMKKHADAQGKENIRQAFNYPGAVERVNILVRRMKDLRKKLGCHIVFTAHEDVQRIYAKGGMITPKGQTAYEPVAVKGQPNLPGNTLPQEFCNACDNVLRLRLVSGSEVAVIARREPLGGGGEYWEVKNRFNAEKINTGFLKPDFQWIEAEAKKIVPDDWNPPYIWLFYGTMGVGKTKLLATFPHPIEFFDLDQGTATIAKQIKEGGINVHSYNPEESNDWEPFLADVERLFLTT